MPHSRDWQGGPMLRSSPGGGGAGNFAQLELTDALHVLVKPLSAFVL